LAADGVVAAADGVVAAARRPTLLLVAAVAAAPMSPLRSTASSPSLSPRSTALAQREGVAADVDKVAAREAEVLAADEVRDAAVSEEEALAEAAA